MGRKAKVIHTLLAKKVDDYKFQSYILTDRIAGDNNREYYYKEFKKQNYSDWTTTYILDKMRLSLDGDIQLGIFLDDNTLIYKSCKSSHEYVVMNTNGTWSCECKGYIMRKDDNDLCHHIKEVKIFINGYQEA